MHTHRHTHTTSLSHSLSTHTNTLDTCVYITVSLCGPLPCNISLIGLVELWCRLCVLTHTHTHTHTLLLADEDQITHTVLCHTHPPLPRDTAALPRPRMECGERRGCCWRREAPWSSAAQSGVVAYLDDLLGDAGWLFRLNYRCIYLDLFHLVLRFHLINCNLKF